MSSYGTWFDKECKNKTRLIRKCLRKFRKKKAQEDRIAYSRKRKADRKLPTVKEQTNNQLKIKSFEQQTKGFLGGNYEIPKKTVCSGVKK